MATVRPKAASTCLGSRKAENNSLAGSTSDNNNKGNSTTPRTLLARWPLAKYAHFITSNGAGTWQEKSTENLETPDMWILITRKFYVQIIHGNMLLECCSLPDVRDEEWRGVRRGPNMLFLIRNNENCRKFRIRFLPDREMDAVAVAQSCANHLTKYFTFHDPDWTAAEVQQQHSKKRLASSSDPVCPVTLQQLTRAILEPQHSKWPQSFLANSMKSSTSADVADLVHACLMDPDFPALVESVEKSLKKLTTFDA